MTRNPTDRFSAVALMALLLVAVGLGGGGSRYGIANLAVQLAAIAALALHWESFRRFWHDAPLSLRLLVAASALLPLLQVVPLPHSVWSALPGRELVARSLGLLGQEREWMPFSLHPQRTLLALTALVTPVAVLTIGWSLPRQRLVELGWLVVLCGILTSLLGIIQLGATDDTGTIFGARTPGSKLLGTFANRNSTALFLGFALGLAAVLPVPQRHPMVPLLRLAVCMLLLVTIILTKSRTGLVLASLPVLLGALKATGTFLEARSNAAVKGVSTKNLTLALAVLGLGASAMAGFFVTAPGRVSETLERFEAKDDPRRFIWDDATYTVSRYWPAGAGTGTFEEIFQVDESLENMTMRRAGRAHNDYIELAIESGIAGILLAVCWLMLLCWMTWRARHPPHRWTGWAGSSFLLAIALQSVTDYPLRNQTMLAMAGFALLLLARSSASEKSVRR